MLLAISSVFEVNYLDYAAPVPYSGINAVTLRDFRCIAKPGLTLDGGKEFAYIAISINIERVADTALEITTYFHPSRSYVYNRYIRSEGLLEHELYHFRIAEYCSRLIRAEITALKNTVSGEQVQAIYDKYVSLEKAMQFQYDEETYHSYVLKEQKKWEEKIDSQLLLLNDFSATIVTFRK